MPHASTIPNMTFSFDLILLVVPAFWPLLAATAAGFARRGRFAVDTKYPWHVSSEGATVPAPSRINFCQVSGQSPSARHSSVPQGVAVRMSGSSGAASADIPEVFIRLVLHVFVRGYNTSEKRKKQHKIIHGPSYNAESE